jgi:5-methylcytosine-specific restriction endonuclease McrA
MEHFITDIPEAQIKREKDLARSLRKTRWWADRLAKGICYYCEQHFAADQLTMDHILPLARGGRSSRSNVVTACKDCNNRKKYLLPVEWREYLERLRGNND